MNRITRGIGAGREGGTHCLLRGPLRAAVSGGTLFSFRLRLPSLLAFKSGQPEGAPGRRDRETLDIIGGEPFFGQPDVRL